MPLAVTAGCQTRAALESPCPSLYLRLPVVVTSSYRFEEHRLSGCLVDACAPDLECLVNDAIERVVGAYKFPRHP